MIALTFLRPQPGSVAGRHAAQIGTGANIAGGLSPQNLAHRLDPQRAHAQCVYPSIS